MNTVRTYVLLCLILVAAILCGACRRQHEHPRLVVVLILDGFRADCADRFLDGAAEGGLQRFYVFSSPRYAVKGGTNHGSPYDDDCLIPLLFYGWSIEESIREGPASPSDITPSLMSLLRIGTAGECDGRPLL
jgi:hypothetical protein